MRAMVRTALGAALAGVLAGCSGVQGEAPVAPGESTIPTVAMTVTTTATVTATATATATVTRGTGKRDRQVGQLVAKLIDTSDHDHKPVRQRYMALIRHASFDRHARWDRALTLTIDKVVWNDRYRDGGKADPYLNPTAQWETIQLPAVTTIVVPRAIPQALTTDEFVDYVNDYSKGRDPRYVYLPPFRFYGVGDRPVAIQEQYIP